MSNDVRLIAVGPMPNRDCDATEECGDLVQAKVEIDHGALTYTNHYCRTHAAAIGAFDGVESYD